MSNPGHGIAGFRLTEHTWVTELGNWIDAISPDGRRAGALLFDPQIIGLPGVRDRVVHAVMTDQRLVLGGLTGLIPVADVVAAGDQVWLLTGQAVSPTLSEVLAAGPIDPAGAVSVLLQTAQTLLALHASGVTHGSVHPGTVVITAEGAALLSERGLSDAIRGRSSPRERDAAGWASLARGLAASFGHEQRGRAEVLERAAAMSGTLGLAAARDLLAGEPAARDGLARAARGRSAFAQARAHAQPSVPPPRDEGDIVTLLHVPGHSSQPGPPVQFGPGIGTREQQPETTAERIWRSGRDQAATAHRPGDRLVKAARSRRRRTILSSVVFAAVMAGAVLAWLYAGDSPDLAVMSVDVAAPKKTQGCGKSVLITGTVVTNGAPGQITYEWRKNLDKGVIKGTLRTKPDQTTYQVPFRWTLQGKSSVKATATLRILTPGPARSAKASFTYKC
ncbi:hypothetical protein FH608_019740 [Nonomuraea phyllanthi]|uniref:Uncharacterized protein n=1 Tax=Nonomuraea phyllanthi TaxID=2219224 RepID=A0A5C4WEN1_9ACTN|nr:hypothetical protein [Nonomuraea phyllanthi]KAB8193470.1 hypothetical protein FH608_019740 [Nonomuraea phyllanthi]QFY12213.1 hypothetical protein GBF35_41625 [Nonomuraea phyllanthi]